MIKPTYDIAKTIIVAVVCVIRSIRRPKNRLMEKIVLRVHRSEELPTWVIFFPRSENFVRSKQIENMKTILDILLRIYTIEMDLLSINQIIHSSLSVWCCVLLVRMSVQPPPSRLQIRIVNTDYNLRRTDNEKLGWSFFIRDVTSSWFQIPKYRRESEVHKFSV